MDDDQDTAQDKVTIQEAARRLGVKEDAIRKRIQRSSLRHEKTEEGRVYVWLDAAQDATQDEAEDTSRYASQDALVEALRGEVDHLHEQLAQANERDRENRRLLAAALERIPPQLEAPPDAQPDARQSPERSDEQQGRGSAPEQPQAATSRRPWWRRVFGG